MKKISKQQLTEKVVHGRGIFTFLRSSVSSQIASWIDMGTRMLFYAFLLRSLDEFYSSNLSVSIGSFVGCVVNCIITYRFTFHASGQSVKAVAVKYFLIWTGSLLLNMYGTTFAAQGLSQWPWLLSIGFKRDGIFAAATLAVSLIVSLAWNFTLQRNFVYRPNSFDRYAIDFVNLFSRKKPTNDSRN